MSIGDAHSTMLATGAQSAIDASRRVGYMVARTILDEWVRDCMLLAYSVKNPAEYARQASVRPYVLDAGFAVQLMRLLGDPSPDALVYISAYVAVQTEDQRPYDVKLVEQIGTGNRSTMKHYAIVPESSTP